jgi:hypothetical protein
MASAGFMSARSFFIPDCTAEPDVVVHVESFLLLFVSSRRWHYGLCCSSLVVSLGLHRHGLSASLQNFVEAVSLLCHWCQKSKLWLVVQTQA